MKVKCDIYEKILRKMSEKLKNDGQLLMTGVLK